MKPLLLVFCCCFLLHVFGQEPNTRFEKAANNAGITYFGSTWSHAWADINKDGFEDFFCTNHGFPYLYINNGDESFQEIPLNFYVDTIVDTAGNAIKIKFDIHASSFGDFDNDGDQDLFLSTGKDFNNDAETKNVLFKNETGILNLKNLVSEYHLENGVNRGRNIMWLDADNDGLLDLMTFNQEKGNNTGKSTLFLQRTPNLFTAVDDSLNLREFYLSFGTLIRNENRKKNHLIIVNRASNSLFIYSADTIPFKISKEIGLTDFTDISVNDFNGDGLLDIYTASGVDNSEVFLKDDTTLLSHLKPQSEEQGYTFQTNGDITIDWDWIPIPDNGYQVFIGSEGRPPTSKRMLLSKDSMWQYGIKPHRKIIDQGLYIGFNSITQQWEIYANEPEKSFVPMQVQATASLSVIDRFGFNDNLTETLQSIYFQERSGNYTPNYKLLGNKQFKASVVSCVSGDFDNDMDVDLILNTSTTTNNYDNIFLQNNGDGIFIPFDSTFFEGETHQGHAGTITTADFNNDGFLDVLAEHGDGLGFLNQGPTELYKNIGNAYHWIEIDVEGSQSNRDGIGALITCYSGGVQQVRLCGAEYHGSGHSARRIHFGLKNNIMIDSVVVRWPSGIVDIIYNISADQIITIREQQGIISGIDDPILMPNIELYPNPTDERMYIKLRNVQNNNRFHYKIFDMQGKLVLEDYLASDEHFWGIIPVGKIPSGLYLLQIDNFPTKQFIKL
ncbi:MAG: FG-GAP-like repeat-containing protein [Chitinophagales bacterium]|nr:FG-GAP-like repeat-containing protein [Chitinophagales bacterium]